VVSHHSWYCRSDGRILWADRLKRWLLRYAAGSIAVSHAIAEDLGGRPTVIPNCYRDELFRRLPDVPRERELLFVGRLVSDKGVDILLEALVRLAARGRRPQLAIAGEGPERPLLEAQAASSGLDQQVTFLGLRTGEELVRLMNSCHVLVVPSRYAEPFGTVALEGIACGCAVVGSEGGGLPEAIGSCGVTFRNGDATDLARALERTLEGVEAEDDRLARAQQHLATHSRARVVARYAEVLAAAAAGPATSRRRTDNARVDRGVSSHEIPPP
jgi:glycogen synthase